MAIVVDPDWWKTLFDEVYLITDARSVCDDGLTNREVDVICELLPLDFDHKILDFCGGHGRHTLELYKRGFTNCTLLDYSKKLIDVAETKAVKLAMAEHADTVAVSSTKSMTGHLLGAAGAIEAVYATLAITHQVAPPTINLENPDPACVRRRARSPRRCGTALRRSPANAAEA